MVSPNASSGHRSNHSGPNPRETSHAAEPSRPFKPMSSNRSARDHDSEADIRSRGLTERTPRGPRSRSPANKADHPSSYDFNRDVHRSRVREERYYNQPRARQSPPREPAPLKHSASLQDIGSRQQSRESSRKGAEGGSRSRRSASRESVRSLNSERRRGEDVPRIRTSTHDSRYNEYPPPQAPYAHRNNHSGYHSHASSSHGHSSHRPLRDYPDNFHASSSHSAVAPYQARSSHPHAAPSNHATASTDHRGGLAARGGRGHFANLSWTPTEGQRGGSLVEGGDRSQSASSSNTPLKPSEDEDGRRPDTRVKDDYKMKKPQMESVVILPSADDDFPIIRPDDKVRSLAAEKENGKISFSIKGRSSGVAEKNVTPARAEKSPVLSKRPATDVSPLAQSHVSRSKNYVGNTRVTESVVLRPSPPPTRKEKIRKKRLKPRPQLSEEHAKSGSVYYRKTGNESVIGSGTYGKVYKAIHVYTGRQVALKKIRMEGERDGFPVTATREIKLLQSLNHVNVVDFQEVMVEKNDCFMVFEYLAHDLTGLLHHPNFSLNAAHKKHLAKQLFEGLDYLHRRGVLHRDIKAANILISKSGILKFADFGLARFYQKHRKQDYTNRVITIWYRPPELLLGETQYGPAVDMWSAACVLVEIFTRHAIFPGDGGEINQLDRIYSVLGTPSRNEWPGITELQWYQLLRPMQRIPSTFADKFRDRVSPEAFELLQAMFLYDPANRPTAADVLEHPYFTSEEPQAQQVWELEQLDGDWHEFESKALRKEKERQERELRKRERDGTEKRKADDAGVARPSAETKKPRTEVAE